MDREELPRVSVGSIQDWKRVKNNFGQSALNQLETALKAQGLHSERDAILAHLHQFVETTFSMSQVNLRVNGHNFEAIDAEKQDMEAFDEVLDRRIWSLADTRLQWHKRMSKTRREVPREIESRLSDMFSRSQLRDQSTINSEDTSNEEDEGQDEQAFMPVAEQTIEELHVISALTEELDQNVPSQQERVQRVENATEQLRALQY